MPANHQADRDTRSLDQSDVLDVGNLRDWLLANCSPVSRLLSIKRFHGGQSNPTYLLNTDAGSFVLRRKPIGAKIKSAHAVDREYRVARAMWKTGAPAPKMLAYCQDTDVLGSEFYVMEFIDGRVLWDPALPDFSRFDRTQVYAEMAHGLAQIHSLDITSAGLEDFGRQGNYFERQISRWSRQYHARHGSALPEMDKLLDWITSCPPKGCGRTSVIHGDYRLDNMIFAKDEPRLIAVIDWELSTLGDPLADLSYQCMQWRLECDFFGSLHGVDRRDQGIPDEQEYKAIYLGMMDLADPDDWELYIVYNMFRFAAILDGVAQRVIAGTAASKKAKVMGALAQPVAEQGWRLAQQLRS